MAKRENELQLLRKAGSSPVACELHNLHTSCTVSRTAEYRGTMLAICHQTLHFPPLWLDLGDAGSRPAAFGFLVSLAAGAIAASVPCLSPCLSPAILPGRLGPFALCGSTKTEWTMAAASSGNLWPSAPWLASVHVPHRSPRRPILSARHKLNETG